MPATTEIESSLNNIINDFNTEPTMNGHTSDRETSPAPSTPTSTHAPSAISDGEELVATGTGEESKSHKKAARPVSAFKRRLVSVLGGGDKKEDRRKSVDHGAEKKVAVKDPHPVIVRSVSNEKKDEVPAAKPEEKSPYRLTFSRKGHPSPPVTPTEEDKKVTTPTATRPPSPSVRKSPSPEPKAAAAATNGTKKVATRKPSGTVKATGTIAAHAVTKKPSRPSSISSASGVTAPKRSPTPVSVEKKDDEEVKALQAQNAKVKEENEALKKQIAALTAALAEAKASLATAIAATPAPAPTTYTHVDTPYPTDTTTDRSLPLPEPTKAAPYHVPSVTVNTVAQLQISEKELTFAAPAAEHSLSGCSGLGGWRLLLL
ncbi:hypothetical protein HDV00_006898 [Rhizophlyctis rosea]|nr:hypothetical protein HDV00_006898 [Rhizophlyctis rosea]